MDLFRILLITAVLAITGQLYAQTYTLGTNQTGVSTTNTTRYAPIGRYYVGSVVELIYLKSELGNGTASGQVTSIQFHHISGETDDISNITVYMKHTSATSLGTATYTASTAGYTQVYSGPLTGSTGWKSIPTSGFSYNGTDNLSVLILRSVDDSPTYDYWSLQTSGSPANMCAFSDGSFGLNYNMEYRLGKRPSTIITIASCSVPTANAGAAMAAICQGGISAALGGSVGGSATTGQWSSNAGGTFNPNATTLNATWTPPAGYYGTATLSLTTTNGCSSAATSGKNITVNQTAADGSLSGSATTICLGQSVTITPAGGIGTPRYWCQSPAGDAVWNIFENQAANGASNTYVFTPAAAGTYRIHARWLAACGFCWDSPGGACPLFPYVDITVEAGPGTAGLTAGEWVFTGKVSTEYENPANWLKWDGTAFNDIGIYANQTVPRPPQITDNVRIRPPGTCVFNQPVTTNLDPLGGGFTAPQSVTANSRNIIIDAGATLAFSGNPSHFHVAETWTNNGTLIPANGRVKFVGTGPQSISNSSGSETFFELNIGPGCVATLNCNVNVTHALRLNGVAITGNKVLHLTNTADDATAMPVYTGHVYGNFRRSVASNATVYAFPVGVGTTLNTHRRLLQYVNNSATGFTYLDCSVSNTFKGSGANIDASLDPNKAKHFSQTFTQVCGEAEWTLKPNATITGGSYGVRLYLANFNPLTDNNFSVLKRPDNSASFYDFDSFYQSAPIPVSNTDGRIYNGGAGYAEKTGLTSFSRFVVASSPVPLPVNLSHFSADCTSGQVKLSWATSSEQNSQKFIVEKSRDIDSWTYVVEVPAAGNSGSSIDYEVTDFSPFPEFLITG